VTEERNAALPDLRPREWVVIAPIVALVILMGVVPNLFLRPMEASVQRLLNEVREAVAIQVQRGN
jgi:NADH-quinone oxidoreductase subunit M